LGKIYLLLPRIKRYGSLPSRGAASDRQSGLCPIGRNLTTPAEERQG